MKKKLLAGLLTVAMVVTGVACGKGSITDNAASSAPEKTQETPNEGSATAQETAVSQDEMTLEELIKAAQDETAEGKGSFMVYAPTSRIEKALNAFKEAYGIEGEYYNESGQDLYTKLTTELEAGTADTADVVLMQDSYLFQTQLADYGYVENYVPSYLKEDIYEEDQAPLVCYYYNKLFIQNNSDGSTGFDNIWKLTEEAYKGKIFMKDISKESVNKNFLAMLTGEEWAGRLAEAYKTCYGSEITLDEDCPNAGYQFIKKYLANVTFGAGDGDIATELSNGAGGNLGLFVYSKLRDDSVNQDKLSVAAYAEPVPTGLSGFMYPMYLQMVTGTDRPYTSKLFIYFLMTEEGFKSAFQTKDADIGTYSANRTIPSLDGDKELAFWKECLVIEDSAVLPQAYADGVLDFITYCIK